MKKILSSLTLLLFLTSSCNASSKFDFSTINDLEIEDTELVYTLEYGDDIDLEQLKYDLLRFEIDYKLPEFNNLELGEKTYNFEMHNSIVDFKLLIEDTKAPQFYGEESFTVYLGEKLNLDEFVKAKDPVDGDLEVEFEEFNTSKLGKQIVIASAKDKNGLESTKKIEVIIKERPKIKMKPNTKKKQVSDDSEEEFDYDENYKRAQQQRENSLKTKNTYFYEISEVGDYIFVTQGAVNGKSVLVVLEYDNGKTSPLTERKIYTLDGAGEHVNISFLKTLELAGERGYNTELNYD